MNVLVVNAFENNAQGNKKFEEFFGYVKNILKRCKEKSGIDRIEYIVKDYNSIDDYLYYTEGYHFARFSNPKNKRNFDHVDLIFFDGGEKYLPWKKNGYKFQVLFKMCYASNKPLFAAGVGIQILLFFLATNFLTELNIINSNGEIQSVEEINSIPKDFLENLRKNDFFLDFVTGDIYEYRNSSKEWLPVMNIGLHKKKVAEKYMYRGKYVLNQNNNRVKSASASKHVISINTENKISIEKHFYSHWLLKDIPYEFIATSNLTWFSHNFSLKTRELQHNVLCVSDNGSMIIEHNESVAVGFVINKKYPYSLKILENYIEKKFSDVHDRIYMGGDSNENVKKVASVVDINSEIFLTKMKNMITAKTNLYNEHKNYLANLKSGSPIRQIIQSSPTRPTTSYLANTSRPFSNIKKVKHFGSHVGLGFSKREMVFVENNAVNERPVSSVNYKLRPQSQYLDKPFSFYLNGLKNSNVKNSPTRTVRKTILNKTDSKINFITHKSESEKKNLFGEGSNLFYNGDIQSVKLIGPPSESNRIAKIFDIGDNSKNLQDGFKSFSSLEELKKSIDKEISIKEGYLNFVPKEKMNDEQMIEYYKKMRRRITQNLIDIAESSEKKMNKLKDNSKTNHKRSLNPSDYETKSSTRNRSPSAESFSLNKNLQINTLNDINEKRDDINVFTLFFPYVRQEDFPLEKEKKVILKINLSKGNYNTDTERKNTDNRNSRERVRLNLFHKFDDNYNKKFKDLEKNSESKSVNPSIRCASPYETDDQIKRRDFLNSKSKWIANNDFKRVFGKHTTKLAPMPAIIGNGSPFEKSPVHYKFREISKDKWIDKKSFRF